MRTQVLIRQIVYENLITLSFVYHIASPKKSAYIPDLEIVTKRVSLGIESF